MFKDNLVSVRKMHGFSQDELAEKRSEEHTSELQSR